MSRTSPLDMNQSESPLANLVRRTSTRRRKQEPRPTPEPYVQNNSLSPTESIRSQNQQIEPHLDIESTVPQSPLLHSHFARGSIATASSYDDNSYIYTDMSSTDGHSDYGYQYSESDTDDRNLYTEATSRGPVLHDSYSIDPDATAFHLENFANSNDLHLLSSPPCRQYPQQVQDPLPSVPLPSVVISLHDPPMNNGIDTTTIRNGRIPVVKPVKNFSRPIREVGQPEHASAIGERVAPQLPPGMRQQKLKVLERNASRRGMGRSSSTSESMKVRSPLSQSNTNESLSIKNGNDSGTSSIKAFKPNMTLISKTAGGSRNHGSVPLQAEAQQGRSPSPSTRNLHPQPPAMVSSNTNSQPQGTRSVSPVSLYSTYSYYEYHNPAPSPSGSRPPTRHSIRPAEVGSMSSSEQHQRPLSSSHTSLNGRPSEGLRTPQDFLQLGIQHHEANRLQESARCFERAATEEGGCGVGMLMYGLTLRHGWGCARNEKAGFKWLRKAAEYAVDDLERVRVNGDMDVRVVEVS